MEDKKKYEKSQSDCETYIQKIRDYCGQIKLKYSEPNVILRRNQKKQISESSKSSNLSRQSSIDSLNERSPTKNKPTSGSSIKKKDRFAESYYKDANKFRVPSSTSQKKNESARNPLNDDDAHSPDLFAKTSKNINTSPKKTESTRRSNSNDADDPAREPNYKSSNKKNPNNLRTSRNSNVASPKKDESTRKSVVTHDTDEEALQRELKTREYESRRNNDTSRKSNEPSSIKRTLSRSLRTSPSSPSDKQLAINKKLNNNDETKIQNTQLQTHKKKSFTFILTNQKKSFDLLLWIY